MCVLPNSTQIVSAIIKHLDTFLLVIMTQQGNDTLVLDLTDSVWKWSQGLQGFFQSIAWTYLSFKLPWKSESSSGGQQGQYHTQGSLGDIPPQSQPRLLNAKQRGRVPFLQSLVGPDHEL